MKSANVAKTSNECWRTPSQVRWKNVDLSLHMWARKKCVPDTASHRVCTPNLHGVTCLRSYSGSEPGQKLQGRLTVSQAVVQQTAKRVSVHKI